MRQFAVCWHPVARLRQPASPQGREYLEGRHWLYSRPPELTRVDTSGRSSSITVLKGGNWGTSGPRDRSQVPSTWASMRSCKNSSRLPNTTSRTAHFSWSRESEPASSKVDMAIAVAVEQGLLWMTNGPASILGEPVPPGVLSSSAKLRPPPDPIAVDELMPSSIPEAWSEEKTNALAVVTALSTKRGMTLPWFSVQAAIESAIRTRWLELGNDSAAWPCSLAGAQHVVLQAPTTGMIRDPKGESVHAAADGDACSGGVTGGSRHPGPS